jgi:transcriptional regulator with XRE-family HTH domain
VAKKVHDYGPVLRRYRETEGITQSVVAEALWGKPSHSSYVSRMESGIRHLEPHEFAKMAEVLHVRKLELLQAMGYDLGYVPKSVRLNDELTEIAELMAQLDVEDRRSIRTIAMKLAAAGQGQRRGEA